MKIFELITPQMAEKQPIITSHKNCGSYLTYSKKINTWIWCDVYGKALEYEGDLVRVVLSKEILEDDTWFIYSDGKDELLERMNKLKQRTKKTKQTYLNTKMDEYTKRMDSLLRDDFKDLIDDLMQLSKAQSLGLIMYLLHDEDCSKNDMKKIIMANLKDDLELRCMAYQVMGDIAEDIGNENSSK